MNKIEKASFKNTLLKIVDVKFRETVLLGFAWDKSIGKAISKRTTLEKYDNGVLFVSVENNSWMNELILIKLDLIKKLRKSSTLLIKDIIFFIKGKKELKWIRKKR